MRWGLVSSAVSAVTGPEDNGLKLRQGRLRLDIRKKKQPKTIRVIRLRNRLSTEVLESLSLLSLSQTLMRCMDLVLDDLI